MDPERTVRTVDLPGVIDKDILSNYFLYELKKNRFIYEL